MAEPILLNPTLDRATMRPFVTKQIDRENAKYLCVCDHECPQVQVKVQVTG